MSSNNTSSRRIVLNALATYGRSLLSMAMMLFSSRWVLCSLGQTDFGLFSVVGSLIVFIVFLNNVLATGVTRFLAFSIGQGEVKCVNQWFNVAVSIHFCLAILLVILGWFIGDKVILNILSIPHSRYLACIWVFRASLVSAFFSMLAVPYVAMFTARQRIAELAIWGILQAVLVFALSFVLRMVSMDKLYFYTFGMVGIVVLVQSIQIARGIVVFDECELNLKFWFDIPKLKQVFAFCGWNLIGSAGALLRDQGSAILLNTYFGPNINAAYGIASQVSSQTHQLSTSMVMAYSPEITASEGRGDRKRVLKLANQANKYGTILMLIFAIPLVIEMEYVLGVWLNIVPKYTATFCRMILTTFVIDRLTTGYMLAVNAHGRIAAYQGTLGMSLLLTLPLSWLLLERGFLPTSIGVAFLLTMSITSFGRALWVDYLLGEKVRKWMHSVLIKCAFVAFSGLICAIIPLLILNPSFVRLILVCIVSALACLASSYYVLTCEEKEEVNVLLLVLRNKMQNFVGL